jgi:hypothetical protein
MKSLQRIVVLCLLSASITASALDQEMQKDLLMSKITTALKENNRGQTTFSSRQMGKPWSVPNYFSQHFPIQSFTS